MLLDDSSACLAGRNHRVAEQTFGDRSRLRPSADSTRQPNARQLHGEHFRALELCFATKRLRDGSRTRDRQFPKLMLCQLSYFDRCSFRTRLHGTRNPNRSNTRKTAPPEPHRPIAMMRTPKTRCSSRQHRHSQKLNRNTHRALRVRISFVRETKRH
ncbi:hypothetical protein CA13_18010 [Planctomycetes bacterium CA13]|uniref:Uncharacterized protein n=1 Tax=Novipirellula herctigrandis TaxID=2527986 RepID=A0A5C5Z055_9BACT|nr:hypothetical protein CA13_18010 [Planctomycetes bacterium CA13]